jgi:hypothetical protein
MLVFVDGAAESVASAYVEVGDLVRIGDRFGDLSASLSRSLIGNNRSAAKAFVTVR